MERQVYGSMNTCSAGLEVGAWAGDRLIGRTSLLINILKDGSNFRLKNKQIDGKTANGKTNISKYVSIASRRGSGCVGG
jgi:hypothetical protein